MKIIEEGRYSIRNVAGMNPDEDVAPETIIEMFMEELERNGVVQRNSWSELVDDYIMQIDFLKSKTISVPDLIGELAKLDKVASKHNIELKVVQQGNGIRFDLY